jgi:hypothetical protein
MIVFETIASNRNLVIPNFNNENENKKNMLLKIPDQRYLVDTEKKFNDRLNHYLNSKYKNKKLTFFEKKILNYYLGSADGKSGKRVQSFLSNIFNK